MRRRDSRAFHQVGTFDESPEGRTQDQDRKLNMSGSLARDGFELECDVCGAVGSPRSLGRGSAPRNFQESWAMAKNDGWACFKNEKGQWWHRCPSCGPAGYGGGAT